jgi:hypothetical protein
VSADAKRPLEVYTINFRPPDDSWLGSARDHDTRIELVAAAVDGLDVSERPLVVLPAGFLRASSPAAGEMLARKMLEVSHRSEAALAFGVDVATDEEWAPLAEPPSSFAYLCEAGEQKLWCLEPQRPKAQKTAGKRARCVEVCGVNVGLLIAADVFSATARKAIVQAHPDLVVLLSHAGPTERWALPLRSLEEVAPVAIGGAEPQEEGPPWIQPGRGWIAERIAETRTLLVHRQRWVELDPFYSADLSDFPNA